MDRWHIAFRQEQGRQYNTILLQPAFVCRLTPRAQPATTRNCRVHRQPRPRSRPDVPADSQPNLFLLCRQPRRKSRWMKSNFSFNLRGTCNKMAQPATRCNCPVRRPPRPGSRPGVPAGSQPASFLLCRQPRPKLRWGREVRF